MIMNQHRIVYLLTIKSLKLFLRPKSYQFLWVASILLLFGGFTFMHHLMKGTYTTHLTSDPYASLQFNFDCIAASSQESGRNQKFHCQPALPKIEDSINNSSQSQKTFSDLLVNFFYTGHLISHEPKESESLIDLITSWMMNGLPLVGLDDYVYLSDWARDAMDRNAKEELMDSPIFKNQFDNFINVRNKRILFTPENNITKDFIDYMLDHSVTFKSLNYSILSSDMNVPLINEDYDNIWAIIELKTESLPVANAHTTNYSSYTLSPINSSIDTPMSTIPILTIRMNPGSIPDTRNLEWSPIKDSNPRQESGELLYFTSGFMAMQLEVQNFLRSRKYQQLPVDIRAVEVVGKYAKAKFVDSPVLKILRKLTATNETWTLSEIAQNISTISKWNKEYMLRFPLFHRAFPTHSYKQSLYWHIFGILMPIALIVCFSLPAALAMGNYQSESKMGVLDVLSTMPNIWRVHSFCAWNITSVAIAIIYCGFSMLFFDHVLDHSEPWIPPLVLFLFSCSAGSIGAILGNVVHDADSLVLALPCLVFITTIPGIIYYEAAVDSERSLLVESLICLIPPSGAVLILRVMFSHESIGKTVDWKFPAPVSRALISYYLSLLLLDAILYYIAAYCLIFLAERKRKTFVNNLHGVESLSGIHTTESLQTNSSNQVEKSSFLQPLINLWTYIRSKFQEVRTTLEDHAIEGSSRCRSNIDRLRLTAQDIAKQYTSAELNVTVLSEIDLELYNDCVTVLLGSNGAGKTTLMKIVAGLDQNFKGQINRNRYTRDNNRRGIGWCPQNDALFSYLTAYEHVLLFHELFACSMAAADGCNFWKFFWMLQWKRQEKVESSKATIMKLLKNVDLHNHHSKYMHQLSGGMKRRLSLTLAFVGDPVILLLDEPTSGCDSLTRELLRKDILSKKDDTAILISTHHVDDIEVLAERVWFLNENHLEIDDWARNILQNSVSRILNGRVAEDADDKIRFSSSDEKVQLLFHQFFKNLGRVVEGKDVFEVSQSSEIFIEFLKQIETLPMAKWKIESPNLFQSLTKLYADTEVPQQDSPPKSVPSTSKSIKSVLHANLWEQWWCHLYAIFYMRWLEVRLKAVQYIWLHILLPFLVIYLLGFSCQDAIFPKTEIFSQALTDGIGEICISSSNPQSVIPYMLSSVKSSHIDDVDDRSPYSRFNFFQSFTWKGTQSSNKMWKQLYKDYYHHPTNRWGAIVMNDTIDSWLQISMQFHNISLYNVVEDSKTVSGKTIIQELLHLQQAVCNQSAPGIVYNANQTFLTLTLCDSGSETSNDRRSSLSISFSNLNLSHVHSKTPSNTKVLIKDIENDRLQCIRDQCIMHFSITENLATNVTLLSNVTTDHAAPIFLKEILFPLHDLIHDEKRKRNAENHRGKGHRLLSHVPELLGELSRADEVSTDDDSINSPIISPEYRLFSFPLPKSTYVNKNSLQRGILGATLMVMYIMINTVTSVRFLIHLKACGVKRQFHLAGMHPCVYILGQYLVEGCILLVTFSTIYFAIYCTEDPIHSFFFSCPDVFWSSLISFLLAILASNYSFTVHSKNQLSSQLILFLTIICGGIFFKLYLDRHHGSPYVEISTALTWISPTFAFSTATFTMFKVYSQAAIRSTELIITPHQLVDINGVIMTMYAQAIIYLIITLCIDYYWSQLILFRNRSISFIFNSFQYHSTMKIISEDYRPKDIEEQQSLLRHNNNEKTQYYDAISNSNILHPVINTVYNDSIYSCETGSMILAEKLTFRPSIFSSLATLNEISVAIPNFHKVAIVGMNGGGKTTFFETCALLENVPSEGKLIIYDRNLMESPWLLCDGDTMGYVPQEGGLIEFATMEECLELFAWIKNVKSTQEYYCDATMVDNMLPIKFMRYPISSMSGGTKKKVAIRLANIASPKLLMLDECTTGVDPIAAKKIVQYLKDVVSCNPTQGLLFASHRVDELIDTCEYILILVQGRKYLYTTIQNFQQLVADYYQVDIFLHFSMEGLTQKASNVINSKEFLEIFKEFCHGQIGYERVVKYSKTLIRMTFRKTTFPTSKLLEWLLSIKQDRLIANFGFRNMEMEEVLTMVIEETRKS